MCPQAPRSTPTSFLNTGGDQTHGPCCLSSFGPDSDHAQPLPDDDTHPRAARPPKRSHPVLTPGCRSTPSLAEKRWPHLQAAQRSWGAEVLVVWGHPAVATLSPAFLYVSL